MLHCSLFYFILFLVLFASFVCLFFTVVCLLLFLFEGWGRLLLIVMLFVFVLSGFFSLLFPCIYFVTVSTTCFPLLLLCLLPHFLLSSSFFLLLCAFVHVVLSSFRRLCKVLLFPQRGTARCRKSMIHHRHKYVVHIILLAVSEPPNLRLTCYSGTRRHCAHFLTVLGLTQRIHRIHATTKTFFFFFS